MMGMNDMMGRCMDAMSSMMGGGMMGSGIVPVVLLLVLLLWLAGLAAVGGLGAQEAAMNKGREEGPELLAAPACSLTSLIASQQELRRAAGRAPRSSMPP